MNFNRADRKAFTLVELLVVVAIIGLLSTVAIIATNNAKVSSRNAKRIADIKQLHSVLSMAYDSNPSGYPTTSGCLSATCYAGYSGYVADASIDAFIGSYLPNKPTDPPDAGARGYCGYIYVGNYAGSSGLDGWFPPGAILDWVLEGAVNCGPGRRFVQNSTRTECVINL